MSLFIDQEWPSPLFDICAAGPTICLLSCFCPCIQYGYNVHNFTYKLQTKPHEDITLPETSCFKATIACACYSLCGLCCINHSLFRKNIRKYNHIKSKHDYGVTCCCIPCAIVQEARFIQFLYGVNTTYSCCTRCYPSKSYVTTRIIPVTEDIGSGEGGKNDEKLDMEKMKGPEDEEDSKEDITPPPVGKSIQGGISTKGFAVGESGGSAKGGGPPGMNRAMSMKRSNSQWIKDDK